MRTGSKLLLTAATVLSACYNPHFSANPDANMGFQCFPSDTPPCPSSQGLTCCSIVPAGTNPNTGYTAGQTVCGDEALKVLPSVEGWCVVPPAPVDLLVSAQQIWDFDFTHTKTTYAPMTGDPMLTGYDDSMPPEWRCPRDDKGHNPKYAAKQEPNDTPDLAIVYGTLTLDAIRPDMSQFEICPDKSAPDVPDIDPFKFIINQPVDRVVIEATYMVGQGDLDVGLFQDAVDPDTGLKKPRRIQVETSAVNNACLIARNLTPNPEAGHTHTGYYYAVVRGAPLNGQDGKFALNRYGFRISALGPGTPAPCTPGVVGPPKDGGL